MIVQVVVVGFVFLLMLTEMHRDYYHIRSNTSGDISPAELLLVHLVNCFISCIISHTLFLLKRKKIVRSCIYDVKIYMKQLTKLFVS